MQEARATTKYQRVSPYKVRLVIDQIRGMQVESAMNLLAFSKKRVAGVVRQTLKSAVANAEENLGLDVDTLVVSQAYVDQGPSMKRFKPRARGRATRILKRTSHITVAVCPQVD
ncbi:LSU ribosomal protein L22P [Magnetococcus marinus MC-1]|uniref:Large ribosomal subunit protein uL22 n=1 Tax=Magnetococcus marinus (strain ATCC BAA-1437 / JCM 17883 / MC-1) TaxID=156889 RepID=RL22_MAGMM|nr:50S ribosomal protein L22 [Magnetococcus marinus]A0L5X8.1 RecName: Full=Large ribosomal subunit protein uL22; AltName: Full=50S ribosomal protein L22 [Magnetococcus marinus MC-1]ABK43371.1 LSU ribosomal protein L22P [Magnetococcus marinus MC-1]